MPKSDDVFRIGGGVLSGFAEQFDGQRWSSERTFREFGRGWAERAWEYGDGETAAATAAATTASKKSYRRSTTPAAVSTTSATTSTTTPTTATATTSTTATATAATPFALPFPSTPIPPEHPDHLAATPSLQGLVKPDELAFFAPVGGTRTPRGRPASEGKQRELAPHIDATWPLALSPEHQHESVRGRGDGKAGR